MRTITKFQAEDGSEWNTEAEALIRERLLTEIARAASLLPAPVGDRRGYVQHDPAAIIAYKVRLVEIAQLNGELPASLVPAEVDPNGAAGRYINHAGSKPLRRAWARLWATDAQGREWGQLYHAFNPGTGPDICLNP